MRRLIPQKLRHEIRRRQRLWQLRNLRLAQNSFSDACDPVTVYGLFSAASGLGQAVRLLADNLEQIGHHVYRIDAAPHLLGLTTDPSWTDQDPGQGPIIFHLNPVEAAEVMVELSPPNLIERTRIAMWLYELSQPPETWRSYSPFFHALWSPSDASAEVMRYLNTDALTVPYCHYPLKGAEIATGSRQFTVMAMADARSSLMRKNVEGAIAAFKAAFGSNDPSVRLVLKLGNLPDDSSLRDSIKANPQIAVIEDRLPFSETMALLRQSDVFLSLHRSEGYGLTLVEALQMGLPVIMTDEPTTSGLHVPSGCWLVPSSPIIVDDPQGIYTNGMWAEPDIDVAATHLRLLFQMWQSGELVQTQSKRIEQASRHFSSPERLNNLRQAMAQLPNKKASQ